MLHASRLSTQYPGEPEAPPRWRWLLGAERRQRVRTGQALIALAMIGVCLGWGVFAGLRAGTPTPWLVAWAVVELLVQLACVLLVRSGRTAGWRDPALTRVQIVQTLVFTHIAYPMAGELRAGAFPIAMVILMFAMFDTRPSQTAGLSALALLLLAAAMAVNVQVWPRRVGWSAELPLLCIMLFVVPGVWLLAVRMAGIRERLMAQRQELREAVSRIEALAVRDALTGLFNRRQAERLLDRALRRHERSGTAFSVALLDLDHFKRVNDLYGHEAGDQVLRHFAQVALAQLRQTDTLARWGGEEFLLFIDEAQPDAARSTAERLRKALQLAPAPIAGGLLGCTVSIGVASARRGESGASLLRRADAALYAAKDGGRNRVELAA